MRLVCLSFKFYTISCFTDIYDERKRNVSNWSLSGDIISCKSINQWWQTSAWQEFSSLYSTLEILRTAKALLIKDEQYTAFIREITSTGNTIIEISQISVSLVVIISSTWPDQQNLLIKSCPLHINLHVYKPLNTMSAIAFLCGCASLCQPTGDRSFQVQIFIEKARKGEFLWSLAHLSCLTDRKHREKSSGTDWSCHPGLYRSRATT